MRILFVCLGNICRSPMAEALCKEKVRQKGITHWEIESRATSAWEEGNPVHQGTQDILAQEDISCEGMFSQKIEAKDFQYFDVILGMDRSNVNDLLKLAGHHRHKVHLFLDSTQEYQGNDVPDPWYTHDFEETKYLVELGLEQWIAKWLEDEDM